MKDSRVRLGTQLQSLSRYIADGEAALSAASPEISGWSVGQHVDHLLKVCRAILTFVERDQAVEGPGISFRGRAVMFIGRIPRGRAKSPAAVEGRASTPEELRSLLGEVELLAKKISAREEPLGDTKKIFKHHIFRNLTPRQTLRFCEVHNDHHLRIIGEIISAKRA